MNKLRWIVSSFIVSSPYGKHDLGGSWDEGKHRKHCLRGRPHVKTSEMSVWSIKSNKRMFAIKAELFPSIDRWTFTCPMKILRVYDANSSEIVEKSSRRSRSYNWWNNYAQDVMWRRALHIRHVAWTARSRRIFPSYRKHFASRMACQNSRHVTSSGKAFASRERPPQPHHLI